MRDVRRIGHYLRSAGIGVALLVLTACGSPTTADVPQSTPQHRIVYGLTFEPSGFDPHINSSSELGIPLRSVYDTLIYRDPADGRFVGGLAEAWEVTSDGLVYSFRLKQGVVFHDGTPFNAQAVGANLDRITSPETLSQKALFLLGTYQRYEIIDDYNIRLILSEPYSPLLDSLSQVYLGIASPTALNQYSAERYQFHQVGTGPFEFVEYLPGDRLVIRRNPDYAWGPAFYTSPGDLAVDEIEFRFYSDPAARAIALESGDVQIMGELLPTDARAFTGEGIFTINPTGIAGQPLQFMMNTTLYPTNSLSVRRALLFGTNRETIVDTIFQRFSRVAWGPLAANTAFYTDQVVGAYPYDPIQARTLLEQEGFIDADNNGYYDVGEGDLEIHMIVPTWGMIPEVAQLLAEQWRAIGIRAVLEIAPTRAFVVDAVQEGEYHLVAFYSFGVDPSFLNDYFLSDAPLNWMNYENPDLDTLLLDAVRQNDPSARAADYTQAQRLIMEQALILPIRDYVNLNGIGQGIDSLIFDVYGWFPLLHNLTVSAP